MTRRRVRRRGIRRWENSSTPSANSSPRTSTSLGEHASERLEERGIMEWQAVAALADGELIAEKPKAKPNATIEVRESLPDGTEFKAVWSLLRQSGVAKLVT